MDFSKIKAITIPEGAVARITCGGAVLWKKLTGRIPNEYQEVEWIGTDGNSYFVSNFTINALDRFTLYYRYSSPSGHNYMFGASNKLNSESEAPRFLHRRLTFIYNAAVGDTRFSTEAVTHDGSFHTMEGRFVHNGAAWLYKDGVQVGSTMFYNYKIFDMLGVFCNNYYQKPAENKAVSGSKIAELRFADDTTGNDVFNPVPCYRRADGVIGMYDTVSKTFFTNQGTGSFTKGEDII